MDYLNKKINFNNILFSASPGLISILLTFFSIPIYLKFLPANIYSSFLISHIFMSLSLILNFNIGKVASIRFQKKSKKMRDKIIINAVYLSMFVSIIFSFLICLILNLIFYQEHDINFFLMFLGILISIMYINMESITKGLGKFKIVAMTNLIFYGFSISGSSFLILLGKQNFFVNTFNLISVSILFKLLAIFLITISIKHHIFRKFIISKKIMLGFKNQSLWMTLTNCYNQIFDYFDKYLIKFFLSPVIFINYLIAQQIASKLTIFSSSIIAVVLPKLASQKNKIDKNKVLNLHLFFFYIPISIAIILLDFLFDDVLRWWLKESFNNTFFELFKIFLVLTFVACQSHIIISFYEANEIAKINSIYESIILIPYIACLFILIQNNNIYLVCYVILTKEIILFLLRFFYIKNNIAFFYLYIFSMLLFIITSFINNFDFFQLSIVVKFLFVFLTTILFFLLFKKYNLKIR
jgi:O-antigen/teichoic acid export membrane protein